MPLPDAVRFSGLGRTRLYQLMGCGDLPYVQMGRRRLIPRLALVEILRQALLETMREMSRLMPPPPGLPPWRRYYPVRG
jgi:hypothetical protein